MITFVCINTELYVRGRAGADGIFIGRFQGSPGVKDGETERTKTCWDPVLTDHQIIIINLFSI